MKLYNKPELSVEKFDVEDVITTSGTETDYKDIEMSAGMEFDIAAEGNEF